jgi:outer membrane receptor protein involved in Fe transport
MRTLPGYRPLFTLTAGALCVSAAWSQAIPAPAPAASQAAADTAVTEVIVTAQRREQTLASVPASVTAMNAAMLDKQGTKDLADIGRLTPGLAVAAPDAGGESTISIRGIASNVGAPTTGVYIDDVPVQVSNLASCTLLCASSAIPKIFDLERVEVLRGPQGTLYGSSSEGGAIRFITATPRIAGDFGGSARSDVSVTQGSGPSYELGATIDGPLQTDVSGFRLSVWSRHDGGWVDRYSPQTGDLTQRDVNSSDAKVARLALRFAPTDRLTVTPAFFYQETRQKDRGTYAESLGVDKSKANIAQPDDDRFGLASLAVEYDFDTFSLKSITSHLARTDDRTDDYSNFTVGREALNATEQFTATSLTRNTQDNWNQELRLTSADKAGNPLSWVGGLYFQRIRQGMSQAIAEDVATLSTWYANFFGVPELVSSGDQSYLEHYAQTETEAAVFGELNYKLTPRLTATTGLRATRTRFNYTDTQSGWWAAPNGPFAGGDSETPITPKFGLSFQRTPDNLIYATAARGFRVGGSNESLAGNATCASGLANLGLSDVPSTYKSDSVWSYELGDKQRLAGGALSIAGSLYWINWNNIQGGVMLTCGFGFVTNMATATSKGFDLELQARPTANLLLSGTLGYDDARYTKTASFQGASGEVVTAKSGDPLNGVPKWSATIAAEYDWHLAADTPAFARIDYQWTSGFYRTGSQGTVSYDADIRNAPRVRLLNLRTGLHRKAWSGSLYVKNAANARTAVTRSHSFVGDTQFVDAALPPRVIGVTLGYDY